MFSLNFLISHFNKEIVIKGFVTALFFSGFIFLEYFEVTNKYPYSISAIIAIALFFHASRPTLAVTGFFVGIIWFYWIAFSLRFYDLSYLIPLAILLIGVFYAIIFLLFGIVNKVFFKIITLYFIQYLEPFDFNWFKPQLMLVNSHFGFENFHFDFFLVSIAIVIVFKKVYIKMVAIIPLLLALQHHNLPVNPNINIFLASTTLPQEQKWNPIYANDIFQNNFNIIDKAIDDGFDIVVLPEAAFPTALNLQPDLLSILKEKSYKIGIVTGGIHIQNNQQYNSTYIFEDASVKIVDKHILVPFGEYIPLPKYFRDLINNIFYNGASDYQSASKPSNFMLKDIVFRNAICYEATSEEIYTDYPKYVIATSNNAWFTPSTEVALQRVLMKYFSIKYNTVIYHSANMAGSGIIAK